VPPCELHALLYGVVALRFQPVSAALFAETFEPPSRELYPERKAMRRGKAPTWRALLHVSLETDPILIMIAVVIVIAATTATA
jgi:hypothetical protein